LAQPFEEKYSKTAIKLIEDHFCAQVVSSMLFSEYLHEKAEESRHNETVGYFIIVIGSIFFIGGLLETVIKVENPEWFLIIPYHLTPHPYSLLGLALTSIGLVLICLGIVISIHYARERLVHERITESALDRRAKNKD